MLSFLRRIATAAQDIVGRRSTPPNAKRTPAANTQQAESVGGRAASGRLVITISQPQPVVATVAPQLTTAAVSAPPAPEVAITVQAAASYGTANQSPLKNAELRSTRHRPSPVAAARKRCKPKAHKPRRAVKVARNKVAVRLASDQSIRMQAALMKCQRQRDAERALTRLTERLPSATIHTLRKAA